MPLSHRQRAYLNALEIDYWLPREGRSPAGLESDRVETVSPQSGIASTTLAEDGGAARHQSPPQAEMSKGIAQQAPAEAARPEITPPLELELEPFAPEFELETSEAAYLEYAQQRGAHAADEPPPAAEPSHQERVAVMEWPELAEHITGCQRCGLHRSRTQTVMERGDRQARWMVIGEAPGQDEDRQGEPFVGRAGQLLDQMLLAIGLPREAAYIANVLKCRPPRNRDPSAEEVISCMPYLRRQVELVDPKIILAVGRIAAQNLLKCDTQIGLLRGRVHEFDIGTRRVPLIVTYHPAYLLRSLEQKSRAWEDLKLAKRSLAQAGGE